MTTLAPPAHDDDPCRHRWVWVDHMGSGGAFVCRDCGAVDNAP